MKFHNILLWTLVLIFSLTACSGSKVKVSDLRCRDTVNPIATDKVVLSWKTESGKNGFVQTAYEIEITNADSGETVHQSGKKWSDRQFGITPEDFNPKQGERYSWRVRVWDSDDRLSGWSKAATFIMAKNNPSDWQAQWISSEWTSDCPMPLFRKQFSLANKSIRSAIASFCGLGCGDLYLNGSLIDASRVIDPAQTNYEQYALYSAFDLTDKLSKGENCLGVQLGEGFYAQGKVWGRWPKYGDPLFILQLDIIYADGEQQRICTDDSWLWNESPVIKANIYGGETYDATKEIEGWSVAGTDTNGWKAVSVVSKNVPEAVTQSGETNRWGNAEKAKRNVPEELRPQMMNPVRLQKSIAATKMWQDPEGNWIYDFGVNITGLPCITVSQPKGTRLTMRMGEALKADSSVNFGTTGVFATGVVQTDEYICAGTGIETWNPRFTYHGFRYLELSGAASEPQLNWISLIPLHSDFEQIGKFECSDPQINRLHELAIRTALSNLIGLPTDCPQREKCGWLGDAHTVAPFESMNFAMKNFWEKYLEDIYSTSNAYETETLHHKYSNAIFYWAEKAVGIPYMIAPGKRLCGVASPDWGTAVVQIPYYIWRYYGDDEPLKKYYPRMKQWVDYVETLTLNDSLKTRHIVPFGLGDWCPPEGNETIDCPIQLSSTAFHYFDASILAKTAALLGKEDDAKRYNELKDAIASALAETFYDKDNKTFGSQTANSLALDFGFVPAGDEKAVSDAIVRNIDEKYDGFLHTGIFGTGRIGAALSRFENAPAAWNLFTKKGENSFAYMFDLADATSLWEILPVNQKSMSVCIESNSSLNHPMLGAYDTWFYEDIAGIRSHESGFKTIRFEPTLTDFLDWAKASIITPYGKTESSWMHKTGKLKWNIVIPANASGIVALPNKDNKNIRINGKAFDAADYPIAERKTGFVYCKFPSGAYSIEMD
ncbi:MAG: glycoside hydrolase family 78 protein [Dysgonamonadaceae bacterium]|jgi:alpha-L-rhamnosidase|nr:glycoside hydrolase family 78 protein [Dysgonamonadaceae bacterium]